MSYKIHTNDAKAAIAEIFKRVKAGKDSNGKEIKPWDIAKTDAEEEVLVHTTGQWEEKGCISLSSTSKNDAVNVIFHYWKKYKKEDRSGDEGQYYLGRFTELILVHFEGLYSKIEII